MSCVVPQSPIHKMELIILFFEGGLRPMDWLSSIEQLQFQQLPRHYTKKKKKSKYGAMEEVCIIIKYPQALN